MWDDAYANIYVYNAVANNILNVPDGTKEQREAKYAEALVGRAFEYLNLVNIFGNHYDPATAATDYGVPILLSEEVGDGASYVRNTVAEVYNQIMSDLKTATPLLPEVATNVYHPNRVSPKNTLPLAFAIYGTTIACMLQPGFQYTVANKKQVDCR